MPDLVTGLARPLVQVLPKNAAAALKRHRGLETVADLLWFLPRRYLDTTTDLGRLTHGDYVVFVGTVLSAATRRMKSRRGTMLTATVGNGDQELDLTFFSAWGHQSSLTPGRLGLFAGQVSRYQQRWQLAHPAYELFDDEDAADVAHRAGRRAVVPVYLQVPGMPSWTLSRCMQAVLDGLDGSVGGLGPGPSSEPGERQDPVPAWLRERRALPTFVEAMRLVHLPDRLEDPRRGRRRLRYDEALQLQVVLAQRRRAQAAVPATPRVDRPGGLREAFEGRLPFRLTRGQLDVAAQISADLSGSHPMNRLLQGEVGSGKTVVALRAMLTVVDTGGQAALLAPTEVLAAQHHRSICAMLGDLALGGMLGAADAATQVVLLTGSQSAAARQRALEAAETGTAGIVIGTHALIQDHVRFAELALVVVDEQHRFGVHQRDALRGKATVPPHVLVMTATPIPRTVAMTVFGDMDTSVLAELPSGRQPIASHVVDNPRWYARTWDRVAEEVAAGHQVYVVCPRIGDDPDGALIGDDPDEPGRTPVGDDPDEPGRTPAGDDQDEPGGTRAGVANDGAGDRPARGVLAVLAELRGLPVLSGARLAMLHGRLPADQKDAVMTAFAAGELDVLVATTVVEVGVDVPNATVMVILDADRFGVSQLHQLRGRVGRGSSPGLCLLVTETENEDVRERLRAVAATTDGFALSRLDLQTRHEGDILGARQSGRRGLRLLRLGQDEELIAQARQDATELVDADPQLRDHPALRDAIPAVLDDEQAAYLERG